MVASRGRALQKRQTDLYDMGNKLLILCMPGWVRIVVEHTGLLMQ